MLNAIQSQRLIKTQEIASDVNVYCDESSTNSNRYMVIGGVWCPQAISGQVYADINKVRCQENLNGELKWSKVGSPKYLDKYKSFISVFFDYPALEFNCIVIDKHIVNYQRFHDNDKELAFYKFYFYLLSRKTFPNQNYWVYLDYKHNRKASRLSDLQQVINNWHIGQNGVSPIQHLEAQSSKAEELIQLADLLIGTVQAAFNELVQNPVKKDLCEFIAEKGGLAKLDQGTGPYARPINIWRWKPR